MGTLGFVALFVLCLFIIELLYYSLASVRDPESKRVKKRLKSLKAGSHSTGTIDILRKDQSRAPRWMLAIPGIKLINDLLIQANVKWPVRLLLLLSAVLSASGYLLLSFRTGNAALALVMGLLCGYLPFVYLQIKKRRRMEKFETQLPDALELIARSLRAGHAFTGGLKTVSEEFGDPIGAEFQRTLEEINFGVSVPDALKNLAGRVDSQDLKYFVVSVVIQRDTGGNLAEVMDIMGRLIRERFKFRGRIKILSAEGRYSGILLFILPILLALAISFLNPRLIRILNEDPVGRIMVAFACVSMIVGGFVMRNMIRIEV